MKLAEGRSTSVEADDHLRNVKLFKSNRHLVIDDAPTNRALLRQYLEGAGPSIIVDEAEDGEVAFEKVVALGADGYDVIWTDYSMPKMNGLELARAVRGLGFKKYLVIVTGSIATRDHVVAEDVGVDLVCLKPLRKKSLDRLSIMQLWGQNDGEK
jgi:two-component system sensor histidine kinase/response regulator